MTAMNIGEMQARITLQKPSQVADGYGDGQPTYVTVGNVWAKLEPMSGREYWRAQQANSKVTHRVTIWFGPYGKQLKDDWRFLYDGRTFNIAGHRNIMEADEFLELLAIEAT